MSNPRPGDYLFPAAGHNRFAGGMSPDWQERGFVPSRRISNPGRIIRDLAWRVGVELEPGDGWHTVRRSVARLFFDRVSGNGYDAALRMTAAFLHHKNTATTEIYLGLELEKVQRDEVMAVGFLSDPHESGTVRLDDYRERASNG